ncbi:MAG: glutaredoxin family protein [Nitrosomonadales bacterium]|nr:glutaredoxin family protein [Nitrosomonadales bacterium]
MTTGEFLKMLARLFVIKWCLIFLLASIAGWSGATFAMAAASAPAPGMESVSQPADIEVFVREGCPHCAKAEAFLAALKQEQPELRIVIRDVLKEPAALERLKRIAENQGLARLSVPTFKVGEQLIVGFSDEASTDQLIRAKLAQTHTQSRKAANAAGNGIAEANAPTPATRPETFAVNFFGHSVSLEQVGLPLFTLAMGLLDGFNPCSMWVLILMISLLAPLNSRSRMFAIAGTFVAVQGLAYFAFMAAWLNLFLLIGLSRVSEIVIAAIALLAGAINLKDFWVFGWGVSLSIPAAAKPGIYARMRRILQAENLIAALLGTVALAVLVQIVEFMCTSGFPALFTRILTLRQLDRLSYYGYLLLYDLAYMLDDVIVLAIGIITLSQRRLQEKEGRWLKLISGLVMLGLGVYLLLGKYISDWTT